MLNILKKRTKKDGQELRDLLNGYQLPSFSAAVINVLGLLREPESSMNDIAKQLEIDPGMHVKVLTTVNSAAFGLSTKVANIPHAASLLGRSRLESIVLSFAVKDTLPPSEMECFDMGQFWLSAARRARLAQALAQHMHPATQSESFSAGFLQDIAVQVLMATKKESYFTVYDQWRNSADERLDVLEKEAFGFDHPTVGALMVEEWDLPDYLVTMISGHHNGDKAAEVEPAVRLVSHIRDNTDLDGSDRFIESCREECGLEPDVTRGMVEKAFTEAEEFSQLLQ
jgi:HD-like signal output (HDOD) protein